MSVDADNVDPGLARSVAVDDHVRGVLEACARGTHPDPDGRVEFVGAGTSPTDGVLAFYGRFIVAGPLDPRRAASLLPDGDLNAPHSPSFLSWCAAELEASPGSLDVVLSAIGTGSAPPLELVELDAGSDHPRVARAVTWRTDCRVFTTRDQAGTLILGRGLAGRLEMAFEVDEEAQGRGLGQTLASAAVALTPPGDIVFAQVSPGNVASMRCVLATGYQPIGSEVLFLRT